MGIAITVEDYLQKNDVPFTVTPHPHTWASVESAQAAHVPAGRLAKAVILTDAKGYLMVVVPSDRHVDVMRVSDSLGRDLTIAPEHRIAEIFKDCDLGAVPPLGPAYGMPTVLDEGLVGLPEVYFEAGDHEELICVAGEYFTVMLGGAKHGQFSKK